MDSVRLAARPTITYRLYDRHESLLYVGITVDVDQRFRHHRYAHRDWWPDVARTLLEEHPNRAEAEYAEMVAMVLERPRKNVTGNYWRVHLYGTGGWRFAEFELEERRLGVDPDDVPRHRSLRTLAKEKWAESQELAAEGLHEEAAEAHTWVGYFAALAHDMGYLTHEGFLRLVKGF
jgi:predicted GIY-YIG superfamily endonuclease